MVIELGPGNYHEAFAVAAYASKTDLIPHDNWAIPVVIEAGVRIGRRNEAATALEQLRARAEACQTPWALGLLARSEALCAADDAAEAPIATRLACFEWPKSRATWPEPTCSTGNG